MSWGPRCRTSGRRRARRRRAAPRERWVGSWSASRCGRGDDPQRVRVIIPVQCANGGQARLVPDVLRVVARAHARSEEHTSELQSLAYLVCRLLLEKKKSAHQYFFSSKIQ